MPRTKKRAEKQRGPASTDSIRSSIGPEGARQAQELQSKYSREVLLFAARTYPRLPASIESVLGSMDSKLAREFRQAWMEHQTGGRA